MTGATETLLQKISLSSFLSRCEAFFPKEFRMPKASETLTYTGLYGSLSSLLSAKLYQNHSGAVVLVVSEERYELYENDLPVIFGTAAKEQILDYISEPSRVLSSLISGKHTKPFILATDRDLFRPTVSRKSAERSKLLLEHGKKVGYESVIQFLTENHFTRKDFVEAEGDFAVRGSIIDVYSYGAAEPFRAEFFGDDIDTLRYFDIQSQLSTAATDAALIVSNLLGDGITESTLLDFLPESTLFILDQVQSLHFETDEMENIPFTDFESKTQSSPKVYFSMLGESDIAFPAKSQIKFNSNFKFFSESLSKAAEANQSLVIATKSQKEIGELVEFMQATPSHHDEGESTDTAKLPIDELTIVPETLYEGFTLGSISLYTEFDIFGKLHAHKLRRKRKIRPISLRELRALKVGDFIVHEDYGIGVFMGLEKVKVAGSQQECVLVHYEKGDKLYVNIQNLHLLSKYSSGEGRTPSLSKLGSDKWQQSKEKIKKRLKDIARNLIELYAKRKASVGFAHVSDTVWMREFEASFIFDETPDQQTAIDAIKKDMLSTAPMDRLICGDAGFGKTEVAMRAAFKAVESGKQVALLVPTTILAHQHFRTFKQRFQNFPTQIEVLSRFVQAKEAKRITKATQEGKVDILIGTHRLISKDVVFKDLGLLIVDEEQHFGVAAKEKLREAFPNVDSLTLSATPIPRTLQFSMMGARDLSIISTPPKNRQPIETIIHEFDEDFIKKAISRELGRNGQVFFLHNRIGTIEDMYLLIKRLFPTARVAYAHGQMPTKQLEEIIMDFLDKEIDVLVCTTIIESGVDISNVNTIVINRADMFGLSDLYQLRGRVGRSERKAYCYLITPPVSTLTQEALQRLAVIEEFTELGSGFNVALRDLDIRGAGNLLGAEQSGFVFDVGFDVYQKLLEEAVTELKSTEFKSIFKDAEIRKEKVEKPADITFFFDALIPGYYVESAAERFALYERVSKAESMKDVEAFEKELADRFGKIPEECHHLIAVTRLRFFTLPLKVVKIDITPDRVVLTFPDGSVDKAYYESKTFENVLSAIQSGALKKFSPQFKHEKKFRLEFNFPHPVKENPKKALDFVREIAGVLMNNNN
ncbi:MAG: transcription-repair coupling factor [Chloroherpetonaceae bacterium]|nr:transcription-repair coupling factor [Chloroherpetonaceae bacterium]